MLRVEWPQHEVSDDSCSFKQVNIWKRLNDSGVVSSSTQLTHVYTQAIADF